MPGYSIFISYAREDEPFKNALVQQLKGLQRQGVIDPWDDRCIDGGEAWRTNISNAIDRCQLALLLVSPAYIASDFIYTEELSRLLERRGREGIRVVCLLRLALRTDGVRIPAAHRGGVGSRRAQPDGTPLRVG